MENVDLEEVKNLIAKIKEIKKQRGLTLDDMAKAVFEYYGETKKLGRSTIDNYLTLSKQDQVTLNKYYKKLSTLLPALTVFKKTTTVIDETKLNPFQQSLKNRMFALFILRLDLDPYHSGKFELIEIGNSFDDVHLLTTTKIIPLKMSFYNNMLCRLESDFLLDIPFSATFNFIPYQEFNDMIDINYLTIDLNYKVCTGIGVMCPLEILEVMEFEDAIIQLRQIVYERHRKEADKQIEIYEHDNYFVHGAMVNLQLLFWNVQFQEKRNN